jgi:hypothetical protein
LRPRREDAPSEAGLLGRRGKSETAEQERERGFDGLGAEEEIRSEEDDSLRALARALLALAEQLKREEES